MFEASQLPDLNMFAIEKKFGLCNGIALLPLSFNREQIEQFTRHVESKEQSVHFNNWTNKLLDYTARSSKEQYFKILTVSCLVMKIVE